MKKERFFLAIDDSEQSILIRALNDKKTDFMQQGKATDAIDDLIVKIGKAPTKRFKVLKEVDYDAR